MIFQLLKPHLSPRQNDPLADQRGFLYQCESVLEWVEFDVVVDLNIEKPERNEKSINA